MRCERPTTLGQITKPAEQEHGDQGCPNLDAQLVIAGADEGLDRQVLIQSFEKKL